MNLTVLEGFEKLVEVFFRQKRGPNNKNVFFHEKIFFSQRANVVLLVSQQAGV